MSSLSEIQKEKYDSLLKEIRVQKSKQVLVNIYEDLLQNKNNLYDDNIIPFQFSSYFIWFLKYNLIDIETQMDIFKLYIEEFFNCKINAENVNKVNFILNIFEYDSNFFRQASNINNFLEFLQSFFNFYYPKQNSIKHKEGDFMDVFINDERNNLSLPGWIRLKIKRIDEEKNLYIFEYFKDSTKEISISKDSFEVQERNTFIKDEELEWRNNLKEGDKIDFLNVNLNWVEAKVLEINDNNEISIDALGQKDNIIKNINRYSPFIQPYLKNSFKFDFEDLNFMKNLKDDKYFFQRFINAVPINENNHLFPHYEGFNFYSLEYYELVNFFINKLVDSKILLNESTTIEQIYDIFLVLTKVEMVTNKKYLGNYWENYYFENVRKIMINFSLNKKMNKSKSLIEPLILMFNLIFCYSHYAFQVVKILPDFILEFGFNCFKYSENLEKRLLGLNSIIFILSISNNFFQSISKESRKKIISVINNKLFNYDENNDLFGLLFLDKKIHEQLLIKGNEIIKNLAELNLLDDKIILKLYDLTLSVPEDSDILLSLLNLFRNITKHLSFCQNKILFDKIMSNPYEKIREPDISIVKFILENILPENDFKIMTGKFLDFYYNYIKEGKNKNEKLCYNFVECLALCRSDENLKYFFCFSFERILDDLENQNNLENYKFLFNIINCMLIYLNICKKTNPDIVFIIKNKYKEIFARKIQNFETIVDKLMELNNKNNLGIQEEKNNEKYIHDIMESIQKLLNFIELKNFFTVESMKKLCEYFIFGNKLREFRNSFLHKIIQLKNEEFDKDKFCQYFFNRLDNYLDDINENNYEKYILFDGSLMFSIFHLYEDINKQNEENLSPDNEMNIYLNSLKNFKSKNNPLNSKYFDVLWKMFLKHNNINELFQFLECFSLRNFSPKERYEIWEKLIQKIFKDINNNVYLSLKMIELILDFSEKYGNSNVKSHLIKSQKKFEIKLKIINNITHLLPEFNFSKNNEKFYSTDIICDIKKIIQKKYGIDPIFFEVDINKSKISNNFENIDNKALFQLFSLTRENEKEEFIIYFKKSRNFDSFPLYPLKNEKGLTPRFETILNEIFYKFAKEGKLDINNFENFFRCSLRVDHSKFNELKKGAIDAFNKFDVGNKGFWSFENFSLFFISSLGKKSSSIYLNLSNLGYASTLDYYLEPINDDSPLYYQVNNVKEFMPRYFIANNKEYTEKIFEFAKNDNKNIIETAQNIIQEVYTIEEIKKNIFEKNKIEEIISNPNFEIRAYAFNLILAELEKDERNEKTQNLLENFLKNNLNNLIIELDNFCNLKEENKSEDNNIIRYFNFYLSNLKLMFYILKKIIGDNSLNDLIDKFDNLNDDKSENNNYNNIKIDLNEDQKIFIQNLKLYQLMNIIGNNTIIIKERIEEIYEEGMLLSLKLLIYIILISQYLPEKEKIEIYTRYTNFEIELSESSSFYLQRLFCSANILLLNIMNKLLYKNYITIKYSKFTEEITNYAKLNSIENEFSSMFDIYIYLLEISIKGYDNEKIFSVFENLIKIILDKNIELKKDLLIGYLNIIKESLTNLKSENYDKIYSYDLEFLIQEIIKEFLIIFDKDEDNNIIEINNSKKYSKYSSSLFIIYTFQIIKEIISINPEKYLKIFFLNEDIKDLRKKHLTKLEESIIEYNPDSIIKNSEINYVGLKNLSSICYMNSVLQQFFMIPFFRNAILSLNIPENLSEEKEDNDNLLFQLIRMFYYLNYSQKNEYNPKNFVYSFKDYDGNPTQINIQMDAQEFLARFIEKIEDSIKNTNQKYLFNNIFGGSTLQQVKCTNPDCGNISERRDNIHFLSLDIKNAKSVKECLDNFIKEEKIEDYHCEKCDKKITNIKKVLINNIPNILIIHLQRISFSYETFNMVKINSQIKFDKVLNIKEYTVDKKNKDDSIYYEYELQGIIIHSGTAQYGHYYSIISNEEKGGLGNWLKFNDSIASKVKYDEILGEAFGNNYDNNQYGSSAYMLIYRKVIKKPVIINSKNVNESNKKIIEEEKNRRTIKLGNNSYFLYENENSAIEKNKDMNKTKNKNSKNIILKNNFIEAKLVSFEEGVNLLINENNSDKEKRPLLKSILLENIKINNDKKFYNEFFTSFIKQEIQLIKDIIISDKVGSKINEYMLILKTINDYILYIIPFSKIVKFFSDRNIIVQNMIDIFEYSIPKELLSYIIKDIIEPNKENFYINYFCSRDDNKGKMISTYIGRVLTCSINNNIENELVNRIIQFYLYKIPVEITKKWSDMEAFNNIILTLVQNSKVIKKSFINKGIIAKLIDLIMGKESPLFKGDERVENKNKPKYGNIVKTIALLYRYYANNWEKEKLNLSEYDTMMINLNKFYEKVILNDYGYDASNMLINYKLDLDKVLNKGENMEEFEEQVIDILIKLKIPLVKNISDIISTISIVSNLIQIYLNKYKINDDMDNDNSANKDNFLEKLNILLGIPIPTVSLGKAEIKYISGKYQDKYTILSIIYSQKEANKETLDILKSLFNLINLNQIVFDYINKLPAPNTLKYSFVDYCIKLYVSLKKDLEQYSEIFYSLKEIDSLVTEISTKYKKDINAIKNNDNINIDYSLYFNEFFFNQINNIKIPDKIKLFLGKLYYISDKHAEKTSLPCFAQTNYFSNLKEKDHNENILKKDDKELHVMLCVILYIEIDIDINIHFKPYFSSQMEIKAKKDNHYFLYCIDVDDSKKNYVEEIDKLFVFNDLKIITGEMKNEELSLGNNNQVADEVIKVNCPLCGSVNIINEKNNEFKCYFCEGLLF